jgi:hypothetical protein
LADLPKPAIAPIPNRRSMHAKAYKS